jgi:hypothetical protein
MLDVDDSDQGEEVEELLHRPQTAILSAHHRVEDFKSPTT